MKWQMYSRMAILDLSCRVSIHTHVVILVLVHVHFAWNRTLLSLVLSPLSYKLLHLRTVQPTYIACSLSNDGGMVAPSDSDQKTW